MTSDISRGKIPEGYELSGYLNSEIKNRTSASEKHPFEVEIMRYDIDG